MRARKLALAAAVPTVLAGAAILASGGPAQSQSARTLTFTELEKGATFVHVRNTKAGRRANSLGDVFAFANPVADASGRVVGKLSVQCVTTTGARNFLKSTLTCTAVVALPDGTLALQANSSPGAATTVGAVTGGTGAYANARGVYESTSGKGGSSATITLAG